MNKHFMGPVYAGIELIDGEDQVVARPGIINIDEVKGITMEYTCRKQFLYACYMLAIMKHTGATRISGRKEKSAVSKQSYC